MRIENFAIRKEQGGTVEVSADVDNFRMWYRVPQAYQVSKTGDTFVAAALLPAMLRGESIEIDSLMPVSPKLLKNIQLLQEIHHCWNPVLKIVPIKATTSHAVSLNSGTFSFFSGGVDSLFSFLKHVEEISHVVFIQGFDFFTGEGEGVTFTANDISDLAQIAHKLDTAIDPVSAFLKSRLSETALEALSKYRTSGSGAGALEVALAADFQKIIVGKPLYDEQRFAGLRLRSETRQMLTHFSDREGNLKLNRLLLEDAYPLEIARKSSSVYEIAVTRNTNFVQRFGKTLIPVSTNHFAFGYRYNLSRNLTQGSALASVALLLGFSRVYVPSAYSYSQLMALGSHPLTDPLYSNECVEIVHDGAEARRVDKVIKIAECKSAIQNLRVCLNEMNVNCGKCSKCMRTLIPLKLLNVEEVPFPSLPPIQDIRKMRIAGEIERSFFVDNLDLALQSGNTELGEALRSCMKRYECRMLFKEIDRVILGSLIKRTYRRLTKTAAGFKRIDTIASED